MARWDTEPEIGMDCDLQTNDRGKRCFVVSSVEARGPAWRSGIRVGDILKKYQLDIHGGDKLPWNEDTLDEISNEGSRVVIAIQVRKTDTVLNDIHNKRRIYVTKRKSSKGRTDLPNKKRKRFDLHIMLSTWDRQHSDELFADQQSRDNTQQATPAAQQATPAAQQATPAAQQATPAAQQDETLEEPEVTEDHGMDVEEPESEDHGMDVEYDSRSEDGSSRLQQDETMEALFTQGGDDREETDILTQDGESDHTEVAEVQAEDTNISTGADDDTDAVGAEADDDTDAVGAEDTNLFTQRTVEEETKEEDGYNADDSDASLEGPVSSEFPIILQFYQFDGVKKSVQLKRGWIDMIQQKTTIDGDLIVFLFDRVSQYVSANKLIVTDQYFYDKFISGEVSWFESPPLIVCMPVCVQDQWSLVIVVQEDKRRTVIHADSSNQRIQIKPVCKNIYHALKKDQNFQVKTRAVPVKIQSSKEESGVHTISNFYSLVRSIAFKNVQNVSQLIIGSEFKQAIKRSDLQRHIEDAISEVLYEKAYWGRWIFANDDHWKWWPCRRVSSSLVKTFDPFSTSENKVPIIWFDQCNGDTIWISISQLQPITSMTADQVLKNGDYDEADETLIRKSYEQAMSI